MLSSVSRLPGSPRLLANAVGFQVGWFACVLGAAGGWAAAGSALAVVLLLLHLRWAPRPAAEARLIGSLCLVGWAWDSALAATGVVHYATGVWLPGTAPYWIVVLWALFGATLNHSMRWMRGRWVLALLFGAIGGPLSFWAGVRLGAAAFPDLTRALLVLSLGWGAMMPALVALAARWDRPAPDAGVRDV